MHTALITRASALAALTGLSAGVLGQLESPPPMYHLPFPENSGMCEGTGATEPFLAWTASCLLDAQAPTSQVHFADWNLGARSYLLVISDRDQEIQRFNAWSMAEWQGHSAFFNSGIVHLELWVDPVDTGVFVETEAVTFGQWMEGDVGTESICDASDDRVDSTDSRVARYNLGGCTHWMASNGAVLTAGHCTDFDPDQGGPGLPDGVIDFSGNIQINPPKSLANGTPQAAPVDRQYPMQPATAVFRFDGEGQGLGKDWCVYRVGANSNTGLRPHIAGGFFRLTDIAPAINTTMRVTGYGSDSGIDNFSNQTDTGTFEGISSSGANIWLTHRVDTEGGNSGSPVFINSNAFAEGIHTNAGCSSSGGANSGTSFQVNALETALRNFVSTTAQFVDAAGYPAGTARNGRIFAPWSTVNNGATGVVSGGTVAIITGTYLETGTFGTGNKAMMWTAPVGSAVIGGN